MPYFICFRESWRWFKSTTSHLLPVRYFHWKNLWMWSLLAAVWVEHMQHLLFSRNCEMRSLYKELGHKQWASRLCHHTHTHTCFNLRFRGSLYRWDLYTSPSQLPSCVLHMLGTKKKDAFVARPRTPLNKHTRLFNFLFFFFKKRKISVLILFLVLASQRPPWWLGMFWSFYYTPATLHSNDM